DTTDCVRESSIALANPADGFRHDPVGLGGIDLDAMVLPFGAERDASDWVIPANCFTTDFPSTTRQSSGAVETCLLVDQGFVADSIGGEFGLHERIELRKE